MTTFIHPGDTVAITPNERDFFIALGARIAKQRKEQDITQVQLAELLGVSQQTVNSYETGRRRIPVSLLPDIAKRLGMAVEALITDDRKAAAKLQITVTTGARSGSDWWIKPVIAGFDSGYESHGCIAT
jgi:transcriptional regulator with XRE-family HTH domain